MSAILSYIQKIAAVITKLIAKLSKSNKRAFYKKTIIAILATFLFLLIIYPFLPKSITYRFNTCFITKKISCYSQNIHDLIKQQGVEEGIEYIRLGILPEWGYGMTHILLHVVGEESFYKTKDLKKSLDYIDPYMKTTISSDGFDGYMHGVFRGYFKANQTTPVPELMRQVCFDYFQENVEVMDHSMMNMAKGDECFHGVGHALMHLNDNNITKSMSDCKLTPFGWMYKACLRGVFMEEMYHFSPVLSKENEYNPTRSMLNLCNSLSENEANICSSFVGESLLLKRPTDINNAISECRQLHLESAQKNCIDRIALLWLPSIYKNNFSKIIEFCQTEAGDYVASCLSHANTGIKFGVAGIDKKNAEFCGLVEEKSLEEKCQNK